ncbi:hypothetical protein MBLNU459_g2307t1 [Dothideomycetes sp. NU459]
MSRFLNLPEALRHEIYKYAMVPTGIIYCKKEWWCSSWESNYGGSPDICVNLLRTCSQVYSEARQVLYEGNTMIIASAECGFWSQTQFWRRSRYANLLKQTTKLFVMLDIKRPFPSDLLEALRIMKALRVCRFSLATEDFTEPDEVPEYVYDILGVIPRSCNVVFGAGDATSVANRVRATYSNEIVYGGKQWLQINTAILQEFLTTAMDSTGAKRLCSRIRIPSSGQPLEDHAANCEEVLWESSEVNNTGLKPLIRLCQEHKTAMPSRFTRFFDLPVELRLRIYHFALAPEGYIGFMNGGLSPPRLDILRTCRQIYEEAGDTIFTSNYFCCHGTIPNMSGSLNERYLRLPPKIKQLYLVLSTRPMSLKFNTVVDEYANIATRLLDFTALQSVRFALYDRNRQVGQQIPPAIYKLRDSIEARGVHVEFGSSSIWEKRFINYQLGSRVLKGEIDRDSIEVGFVLS